VNLALNKPTYQNSTGFDGDSGRAVDGNTNGNFGQGSVSHTAGQSGGGDYWQVNLQGEKTISSVVIWGRTDSGASTFSPFDVTILDTTGYKVLKTVRVTGRPSPSLTVDLGNTKGGYVRITSRAPGFSAVQLAEVQVLGFQ
jgi:hypothetical protein